MEDPNPSQPAGQSAPPARDPHADDQERGASEPGYQPPAAVQQREGDPIDVDAHVERAQSLVDAIKLANDRAGSDAKVHPTHFQELMQIIERLARELHNALRL